MKRLIRRTAQGISSTMPNKKSQRKKFSILQQLPLLFFLVFVWCALWQNFDIQNIIFGIIIAFIVVKVFHLPPVVLGGRFNIWWFFLAILWFGLELITASARVFWLAVTQGSKVRSAVIGVKMETNSDLIIAITEIFVSLIPGSTVLELDRTTDTVYMHALDINNQDDVEHTRKQVEDVEELVTLVLGSKDEAERIKEVRHERKLAQQTNKALESKKIEANKGDK